MGIGVKFPNGAAPIFYFTKNGAVVYQRIWDALKNGSHHLAIGMESQGEKAQLLDSDMWLLDNENSLGKQPAKSVPLQKLYNFSVKEDCSILHSTGLLSWNGCGIGGFLTTQHAIAPRFSNYIEIEIASVDVNMGLVVGKVPSDYGQGRHFPGFNEASVGYHPGSGKIWFESNSTKSLAKGFVVGNLIGVGVNFQQRERPELFFTRNGEVVYQRHWKALKEGSHRFAVVIHMEGTKVILLDSDMWH